MRHRHMRAQAAIAPIAAPIAPIAAAIAAPIAAIGFVAGPLVLVVRNAGVSLVCSHANVYISHMFVFVVRGRRHGHGIVHSKQHR
eukprot:COSAG01_NODE_10028_length_2271_cov_3.372468_3_plen_85_part_00